MKYLLIGLIKLYKILISLFIGRNKCKFYPTCSNYTIEAIEKRGIIIGLYLSLFRIIKCNPFTQCKVDLVPEKIVKKHDKYHKI